MSRVFLQVIRSGGLPHRPIHLESRPAALEAEALRTGRSGRSLGQVKGRNNSCARRGWRRRPCRACQAGTPGQLHGLPIKYRQHAADPGTRAGSGVRVGLKCRGAGQNSLLRSNTGQSLQGDDASLDPWRSPVSDASRRVTACGNRNGLEGGPTAQNVFPQRRRGNLQADG